MSENPPKKVFEFEDPGIDPGICGNPNQEVDGVRETLVGFLKTTGNPNIRSGPICIYSENP